MEAKDIFTLNDRCFSHQYESILYEYWSLEMVIADENYSPYSDLEDYGKASQRACELCGSACITNEAGIIWSCINEKCVELRSFWGIHGPLGFSHISSGKPGLNRSNRYSYLKTRMRSILHCEKISEIPAEIRFVFLLSAMVERIAHEKNNTRDA